MSSRKAIAAVAIDRKFEPQIDGQFDAKVDPKKRALVIVGLIVVTAFSFWFFSRYPDLDRKAQMAEAASSIGDISPWPVVSIDAQSHFLVRWALTTVNWVHANLRGMGFGLAIAAMVLTLINYFPNLRRGAGPWSNSALGVAIGVPLGLCVNCSAPVFKSVLRSGRVETAFALMLSSPTLNIVTLSMVFSLFPLYMALTKVAVSLVVLFVAVPLLSRAFGIDHAKNLADLAGTGPVCALAGTAAVPSIAPIASMATMPQMPQLQGGESWRHALPHAFIDFLRRLLYLSVRLVPLMVFAGSLGALLVLLHPTADLARYDGLGAILVTAAIGVVLPVPIAFDVMLASSLAAQGLPTPVVLTLLCTLGSFSVLAFLFVATSASKRWAFALLGVFFGLGTLAGVAADPLHDRFLLTPELAKIAGVSFTAGRPATAPVLAASSARGAAPPVEFTTVSSAGGIRVSRAPFRPATPADTPTFVQHEGPALGLATGWRYDVRDYSDPFWIGRGTASGDFNRDGWQDIAFGSDDGVLLYANRGGRFEAVPLRNAQDNHLRIYAVAFADMDNDGWPDLVITSFNHGNFVLYNRRGEFDYAQRVALPNNAGVLTVSPAFADIDGNGLLDIVNGNMALGVVTGSHQMARGRANSVLFNGGVAGFRDAPLETDSGETMSTLVSDLNNDGRLDLYFGNDFIAPDKLLLGTGNGFAPANAQSALLARTPFFSMSADTADIDNDLQLDLLSFGTTSPAKDTGKAPIDGVAPATYTQAKWTAAACDSMVDTGYRDQCRRVRETNFLADTRPEKAVDVVRCKALSDPHEVKGCLLVAMWHLITHHSDPGECKTRFGADALIGEVCEILAARGRLITQRDSADALAQGDGNFVYRFDGHALVDINRDSPGAFVHPGGWTWNAKFADLDNDGYQDIFNADGAVRGNGYGFNVFMHNIDGKRFEQRQFSQGLVDDFGIYSYTFIDYDNDGDLDIIANGAVGPVRVFENRSTDGHRSVAVSVIDGKGNRFGIGAKVFIRYAGVSGQQSGQQVREIKASGGYMSFDASVAFFGLGKVEHIDQIRVRWRDGTDSVVQGPFAAGHHYRVEREP
jgi:uncharacterized membrane protein YraQ (UPF0718 family)